MAHDSLSGNAPSGSLTLNGFYREQSRYGKECKSRDQQKDEEYNGEVSKLDMIYRREYDKHMQTVKTQTDMDAAQNELKTLSDRLKGENKNLIRNTRIT